eukprot:SAG31_NODE_4222_length_3448_cov_5.365184_3_plen_151_part_00
MIHSFQLLFARALIGETLHLHLQVSEAEAARILDTYSTLVGLFLLLVAVLMVVNLCSTRIMIQRITLEGRYYQPLDENDLDEDYGSSNDVENATRRRAATHTDHDGGEDDLGGRKRVELEMADVNSAPMHSFAIGDDDDDYGDDGQGVGH